MTLLLYGANGYTGELIAREAVRRLRDGQDERWGLSPPNSDRRDVTTGSGGDKPHRSSCRRRSPRPGDHEAGRRARRRASRLRRRRRGARTGRRLGGAELRRPLLADGVADRRRLSAAARPLSRHHRRGRRLRRDRSPRCGGEVGRRDAGCSRASASMSCRSDCLSGSSERARLPTATRLTLAFRTSERAVARDDAPPSSKDSRTAGGSARTASSRRCRSRRRRGESTSGTGRSWPCGSRGAMSSRRITATGIGNIEVFMHDRARRRRCGANLSRALTWLLRTRFVQERLHPPGLLAGSAGPSAEKRAAGVSVLWGEVVDNRGGRAVSRLHGPESYRRGR